MKNLERLNHKQSSWWQILSPVLFLILVFTPLFVFSKNSASSHFKRPDFYPQVNHKTYHFTSSINYKVYQEWNSPYILWFFVHNSEFDARANFDWGVQRIGGVGVRLENIKNPLKRNIKVHVKNVGDLYLDPNRMFSLKGLKTNLWFFNSPKLKRTKDFKKAYRFIWYNISKPSIKMLQRYWSNKYPMIALHNNEVISVDFFKKNADIFETYEDETQFLTSFVLVTSKKDFDILKKHQINAIWQKKLSYDGSLSDFAIRHHLSYANIETHLNDKEIQKKLMYKVSHLLYPEHFSITQSLPDAYK